MTTFTDLGLAKPILRALSDAEYVTPTPIQARAVPPLLEGRDLLGIAQTGTGKTAAFALPILHRLHADQRPAAPGTVRVLVLAPTRELAAQIADSFRTYGQFMGVRVGCIVGGVSARPQAMQIARGLDVLVATPGRLLDHMSTGAVRLGATEVVVLDEADHMLDLGFIIPIKRILAKVPAARQTLLFSATMPAEISALADGFLRDPVRVAVTPAATTVARVQQSVYLIETAAKPDLLVELLGTHAFQRTIVFTRTKRGADKVTARLETAGIGAVAIHGNKSQGQRQRALESFRAGATPVLVATDIAARGIDVDGVTHVVNYELPDVPEAYVHRIGRTARAGAEGSAVAFCAADETPLLRAIEKKTRQAFIPVDRRGTIVPTRDAGQPSPGRANPGGSAKQGTRPPRQANGQKRPGQRGFEAQPARFTAGAPRRGATRSGPSRQAAR